MIAQWPNAPLWIYIASVAAGWVLSGDVARAVAAVGTVALVTWALLEVFRGVNPFRRALGAAVLVGVAL